MRAQPYMNFAILLKCLAPGFELVHRLHFIHWFLAAAHILDGLHGLVVEVLAGLGVVEAGLAGLCHAVRPAHLFHHLLEEADLVVRDVNCNCCHNRRCLTFLNLVRNRFRSEYPEILSGLLSLNRGFLGCKDSANRAKYQRKTFFSLYFRDAAYLRPEVKDSVNREKCQIKLVLICFVERMFLNP